MGCILERLYKWYNMEKDLRMCKVCKNIKVRIQDGRYPGGKYKRFVGDNGSEWNGSKCPECHREGMKNAVAKKRHAQTV